MGNWYATLQGKRILIGLDFAFGYPSGLAQAAQLSNSAESPWAAIHEYLGEHVIDQDDNAHNMYDVAASLNHLLGGGPGPFWGCPTKKESETLTTRRIGRFAFPHCGLGEWRVTDRRAQEHATTQSVWKLNCGVSVGGQTILGIHRLHQMRLELGGRASIWPFETGWQVPAESDAVVFAEIFPSVLSLARRSARRSQGRAPSA